MTKITCDRCGKKIEYFPQMQQHFPILTIICIPGPKDDSYAVDLCDDCIRDFFKWLEAGKAESKEVPEDYDIEIGDL